MAKDTPKLDIGALGAIASLGGTLDPKLSALLMKNLQEQIDEVEAAKEQNRLWRKANAEALGEARKAQREERTLCSHRKENGETALAGQQIGNGQLCLVCLKCNGEFHRPVKLSGQIEPPLALIPTSGIGGPAYS